MELDLVLEDDRWRGLGLEDLARPAIATLLGQVGMDAEAVELTLLGCDDARIAGLNAAFRDAPRPTNVLSWPAQDVTPPDLPQSDAFGAVALGDIALSYDTCAREAEAQGKPLAHHVTHLIVHGTLHLLGYDHIEDTEAGRMEALEVEILGKLGLPDPYSTD